VSDDEYVTYPSKDAFTDVSSEELYKTLQEIDPELALRLHPHDRRKIIR
jgi:tRNA A37 N6-isopentenylltransferase MiaA